MKDKPAVISSVPKIIIVYELFSGLIEILSALSLFIFGKNLLGVYEILKTTELFEDPNDLIVKFLQNIIPNLFKYRTYIGLLLLTFGMIKVVSGIGLIYKKVWAEHLLVIFLILLVPFELVGVLNHFSFSELIYLLTDILIVLYLVRFKPLNYYQHLKYDVNSLKKLKE